MPAHSPEPVLSQILQSWQKRPQCPDLATAGHGGEPWAPAPSSRHGGSTLRWAGLGCPFGRGYRSREKGLAAGMGLQPGVSPVLWQQPGDSAVPALGLHLRTVLSQPGWSRAGSTPPRPFQHLCFSLSHSLRNAPSPPPAAAAPTSSCGPLGLRLPLPLFHCTCKLTLRHCPPSQPHSVQPWVCTHSPCPCRPCLPHCGPGCGLQA